MFSEIRLLGKTHFFQLILARRGGSAHPGETTQVLVGPMGDV